jgi:pyruvate dehydrogenase (quinone)
VIIPSDLQEQAYSPPEHAFKQVPSSPPGHVRTRAVAPEEEVRRAADILNAGTKVAILIGQGARHAAEEVQQVAELTGAGVAKALLGKDVLSDELPYVTGSIGLLGTRPSYELMEGADTLLMVGSNMPYSQFLPDFGQARAVQIDIDGRFIGMRYPTEVNLVGDARATLQAMIPHLQPKTDRSWRARIEKNVAGWWHTLERQAMVEADPVNPMRIVWELSSRIPDDAIVTCDSGSAANWYARDLRMRGRMRGSLSGTLATMGCAVPYLIGAKFARPDRPVVALVGDGAMQMNGLAELITISRYYREWSDRRCVICVLHNNDLNQVTWELRAMGGSPKFEPSQVIPDVSYAGFARSIELGGIDVDSADELGPAWDQALAANRPVVLDVRCDPNIPPIPPHVSFEQMKSTAESLLRGDPEAWEMVARGIKTKVAEFVPRQR